MNKEYITFKQKEVSVKLRSSDIDSIRVKDIERHAVRVYRDQKIGISGAIGSVSRKTLEAQAIDNLSANIPYNYPLESQRIDHRCLTKREYSDIDLLQLTEKLLTSLKETHDDFIFSESIKAITVDQKFHNTLGLDLRYRDHYLELGFLVKAKTSTNLMDTYLQWSGRQFDEYRFIQFARQFLNAERNSVALPKEEKVPVFFVSLSAIEIFFMKHLNGEIYGNHASLFEGKLGKKLFHDKLILSQNHHSPETYSSFFDMEGRVNPNDKVALIDKGVFKRVYTDKKTAKTFDLEYTGGASGGYDDVPSLRYAKIMPEVDSNSIHHTLGDKPAILVLFAEGGEVNAEGQYATPVQAAYLMKGETLIGKCPEFNMSNHVFDMFGKDYIGTFTLNEMYIGENQHLTGCYMQILK